MSVLPPAPPFAPVRDEAYIAGMLDRGTAVLAEAFPRLYPTGDQAVLTSAQVSLVAVPLPGGVSIANVNFIAGTTALNTATHQWAGLWNQAGKLLAVSADRTNTAWAANTAKAFALAAAYTAPVTEWGYAGLVVVASVAVPTLAGVAFQNVIAATIPPVLCGNADAGLVAPNTAPATLAAIVPAAVMPYAYLT